MSSKLRGLVEELKAFQDDPVKVPDWKPGKPVPDGYKVVFGRLARVDTSYQPHHVVSTYAWKTSAAAKTGRDHAKAYFAHREARDLHQEEPEEGKQNSAWEAGQLHQSRMDFHKQRAHELGATEFLPGQSSREFGPKSKMTREMTSEMGDVMRHLVTNRVEKPKKSVN
jgi:hypothetical protein